MSERVSDTWRRRRRRRVATRVLACAAAVPIGLGPSVVAFAQTAPPDDPATPVTTQGAPLPDTTLAPTTAAPTTSAPTTSAPTTLPTDTTPISVSSTTTTTIAATPDNATTTTTDVPATGTTEAPAPDPTAVPTTTVDAAADPTTSDPSPTNPDSATTIPSTDRVPDPATTTDATVDPAPPATRTADPTGATPSPPDSSSATTAIDPTTTVDTTTTTLPGNSVRLAIVAPPTETIWTLGLRVENGWTYTGPFNLNLRARFGGSTVALQDGEVSGPLVRNVGTPYAARVEMGSSYDPAFGFRWECTGDVSGLSIGTTEQYTPPIDPFDSTMDCVFIVDNSNPPTLTVETNVEGDPAGLVEFDTSIDYNFFGTHSVASFTSVDGTSRTIEGVAGFPLTVVSVATGSTPAGTLSNTRCEDALGNYVGGFGLTGGASASELPEGAAITCVVTHTIPGTLTIVEDVVPNDPAAPAGFYSKSRFTPLFGPDSWELADGESLEFSFGDDPGSVPALTRTETPGFDVTSIECNELLGGGAVVPYTDFTAILSSFTARLSIQNPPAGTDLVCRFVVEPAGPPEVSVQVVPNVFDVSTLSDFEVEVRGPSGLIDTLVLSSTGSSEIVVLDALGGDHSLLLLDDQGLELDWRCDAGLSSTATITFPTVLGERVSCTLTASDPFPSGDSEIRLFKDEEPDNFDFYDVVVMLGDFVVGSGQIYEGGPGLVISDVLTDTYTVTEVGRYTDYVLSSVDCVNATTSTITNTSGFEPGEEPVPVRRGTFTLDTSAQSPGTETECTLVNSPTTTPAIVRIETVTVPSGDTQSFDYEITPASQLTAGAASFSQVDGDSGSRGVDPGFLTIEQQPVAGYTTQRSCAPTGSPSTPIDGFEVGLFISPDFDYTCRFINTAVGVPEATLDVVTVIDPANGAVVDYSIVPAASVVVGSASISQRTGETTSVTTTVDAPITVGQTGGAGFRTTSQCVEGATVVATGTTSVSYTPSDGDAIVCTFTHRPLPSLTIIEDRVPDGLGYPATLFDSTTPSAIVSGAAIFSLADNERRTIYFEPGSNLGYTRNAPAEIVADGTPTCTVPFFDTTTPYSPIELSAESVVVNAGFGEQITCVFRSVEAPPPQLVVENLSDVADPSAFDDFEVEVTETASGDDVATLAVAINGTSVSLALDPITRYTLTVVDDFGLTVGWLTCGSSLPIAGTSTLFLSGTPGSITTCTFRADGPVAGTAAFDINIDHDPDAPGIVTDISVDDGSLPVTLTADQVTGDGTVSASDLFDATFTATFVYPFEAIATTFVGDPSCALGGTTIDFVRGVPVTRTTTASFDAAAGATTVCTLTLEAAVPSALIQVTTETLFGVDDDFTYTVTPVTDVLGPTTFVNATDETTSFDVVVGPAFEITQIVPAAGTYTTTSSCENTDGTLSVVGGAAITVTPSALDQVSCVFVNEPLAPSVTIRTITSPPTDPASVAFDYTVAPGGVVAGASPVTSPFSQGHEDSSVVSIEPEAVFDPTTFFAPSGPSSPVPTLTQSSVAGYATRVGCYDPATETEPSAYAAALSIVPTLSPGGEAVCVFENTSTAPSFYDLTIEAVVDTGVIDLSDVYRFSTEVSGPGVDGAGGLGTASQLVLGDADRSTISVLGGTDVRIEEVDALAGEGLFRTSIACGSGGSSVVNAAADVAITDDTVCTVTFAARTLSVEKQVVAPVAGGPDVFDFAIDPVVGASGDFQLGDGDDVVAVVPLGQTIELTELDPGPYGVDIDCTTQTAVGPTSPFTGPAVMSNTVTLADPNESLYCEVNNFDVGPTIHEVVVNSVVDLGGIPAPSDLAGFFVELDGDLVLDQGSPSEPVELRTGEPDLLAGPGSSSLQLARSSFVSGRFIEANGSISFFVEGGSDLTIAVGAGSERFANTIQCGFGIENGDGSRTLPNVSSPVACTLLSEAGVLEVRHEVQGTPPVTEWPFAITEVIAGDRDVSLGDDDTSLSAVAADVPLNVTLLDRAGASSVSSSCVDVTGNLFRSGAVVAPAAVAALTIAPPGDTVSVSVPGGRNWRCTFVTTYQDTTPTDTTPTDTGTTPTDTTPTNTTPTDTTPTGTTPVVTNPPSNPLAPTTPTGNAPVPTTPTVGTPTGATPTDDDPPSETATEQTPTTVLPAAAPEPPAATTTADTPETETPEPDGDEPVAITITDEPEDIYVDIGDPIPVDVECAGELIVTVDGERQGRVDQIEPSALGVGDHVIEVVCDGETITSVRAVVFDQEESAPAGNNMTVIVMFVMMAAAGFLFAPAASGRKRLPV